MSPLNFLYNMSFAVYARKLRHFRVPDGYSRPVYQQSASRTSFVKISV